MGGWHWIKGFIMNDSNFDDVFFREFSGLIRP